MVFGLELMSDDGAKGTLIMLAMLAQEGAVEEINYQVTRLSRATCVEKDDGRARIALSLLQVIALNASSLMVAKILSRVEEDVRHRRYRGSEDGSNDGKLHLGVC